MNHPTPSAKSIGRTGLARTGLLFALPAALLAQSAGPAPAPAKDEVVQLTPFTVSGEKVNGYQASNAITGTRTDTPIKDIPLNIQVFTKDFADDFLITNQIDMERYNASLINGGADARSSNPIQQQFNAFLFRGFVQNWGLRDGIRQYDPIDAQGLARVEVVKGPVGALYGVSYPGGVMNSISKDVDFNRNFGAVRLTTASEGEYRATIDANYSGNAGPGKVGVRFNAANTETKDERAHSEGTIRFTQTNLNWRPFADTELKFMMEDAYRGKPNGLSYFSRGETDALGNTLGNGSNIPLQEFHKEIPYTWNWSNGKNLRSLDSRLVRGSINQRFSDSFSATAYFQYASREQIDGNGWDANGSGGADSWEAGGGWIIDPVTKKETIQAGYSYRDWSNAGHSYGATGVYKFDFPGMKNTVAFGANVWQEDFVTKVGRPVTPTFLTYEVKANIPIAIPFGPPVGGLHPDFAGGGYAHEDNSNDNVFVNWQTSSFNDRLKTTIGFNRTKLKLIRWDSGDDATAAVASASKNSPMYGAVFSVTKDVSVFVNHATSLFPNSNKNSFGQQMPSIVGKSYEFGAKFELLDGRLSGTVSYYTIEQTGGSQFDATANNVQTARWDGMTDAQRAITFPGQTRAQIAGDQVPGDTSESKGFEFDIAYQPTKNLQVMLSYANNNNEVTEALVNKGLLGQSNVGSIKSQWSLLSKYSFSQDSLKGLSVGGGVAYAGKSLQGYFNGTTARYYPSTLFVEAFAGYKFKALGHNASVQLNLKNLAGQDEYFGWKATGSAAKLSTEPYKISMPITYALTFGLDF